MKRRPSGLLDREASLALWTHVGDAACFAGDAGTVVWKLSVPPSLGAAVGGVGWPASLRRRCYYDWGGGADLAELPDADHAQPRACATCCRRSPAATAMRP